MHYRFQGLKPVRWLLSGAREQPYLDALPDITRDFHAFTMSPHYSTEMFFIPYNIQHQSNGDCLSNKRKDLQNHSLLHCAPQLWYCVMTCTYTYTWEDGGGGHWLGRMEWRPAGWSVCLPLLIFPCTTKSRSSLLAPAHPGGPGKRAVKRLWYTYTWTVLTGDCGFRINCLICEMIDCVSREVW